MTGHRIVHRALPWAGLFGPVGATEMGRNIKARERGVRWRVLQFSEINSFAGASRPAPPRAGCRLGGLSARRTCSGLVWIAGLRSAVRNLGR
jgi:hypothetical protein